jgi:peptide deformylase
MSKPGSDAVLDFDLDRWLAALEGWPPIVQTGARVLRFPAKRVPAESFGTPALEQLAKIMVEVMRQAPGVGLAAPQIGVPMRIFVAEDLEERIDRIPEGTRRTRGRVALPLTVLVNPVVVPSSQEQVVFFEGCLSVRGFAALVPRARSVSVSGQDLFGDPVALTLTGWPARIMQHEMDHLDGNLYVDRMISRSFAGPSEIGRLSDMPVDEVLAEIGAWPHGESP